MVTNDDNVLRRRRPSHTDDAINSDNASNSTATATSNIGRDVGDMTVGELFDRMQSTTGITRRMSKIIPFIALFFAAISYLTSIDLSHSDPLMKELELVCNGPKTSSATMAILSVFQRLDDLTKAECGNVDNNERKILNSRCRGLVQRTAIWSMLECMQREFISSEVFVTGCSILYHLLDGLTPKHVVFRSFVWDPPHLGIIVGTALSHSHPSVKAPACKFLRVLTRNQNDLKRVLGQEPLPNFLGRGTGLDFVLRTFQDPKYKEDVEIQAECTRALYNLVSTSVENRIAAVQGKAIETMVELSQPRQEEEKEEEKNVQDVLVQLHAWAVLERLADPTLPLAFRDTMALLMTNFERAGDDISAAKILGSLREHKEDKEIFATKIFEILQAHQDDSSVKTRGLQYLSRIVSRAQAGTSSTQRNEWENHIVSWALETMANSTTTGEDQEVQAAACRFLYGAPAETAAVIKATELSLQAIKMHPDKKRVPMDCSWNLYRFLQDQKPQQQRHPTNEYNLFLEPILSAVLDMMGKYPTDPDIQLPLMGILRDISSRETHNDEKNLIINAGGKELITSVIRTPSVRVGTKYHGVRALQNLGTSSYFWHFGGYCFRVGERVMGLCHWG